MSVRLLGHSAADGKSPVVSLYFHGVGSWVHPLKEHREAELNHVRDQIKFCNLKDDVIYEVTLTNSQRVNIEPLILPLGFKHVHTSKNPNTFNIIYTYVRSPLPLD